MCSASKLDFCKNINRAIHLKFIEQYCNILMTFYLDFEVLKKPTIIMIPLLNQEPIISNHNNALKLFFAMKQAKC